jgi:proliferating cell nuclear antigen
MIDHPLFSSSIVTIDASKEGIKFMAAGELGNGQVTLRQNMNVDRVSDN